MCEFGHIEAQADSGRTRPRQLAYPLCVMIKLYLQSSVKSSTYVHIWLITCSCSLQICCTFHLSNFRSYDDMLML